jgi:hypothetical protein
LVNYIKFRNRVKFVKDNIIRFIFCLKKFKDIIIILIIEKNKLEKKLFNIYNYISYIKFRRYIISLVEGQKNQIFRFSIKFPNLLVFFNIKK